MVSGDELQRLRETSPQDYLNLIVEVVEARYVKRRQALFYRRLTIAVTAILGLLGVTAPFAVKFWDKRMDKRVDKRVEIQTVRIAKVGERLGEIPTPLSRTARTPTPLEPMSTHVSLDADSELDTKSYSKVTLAPDASWHFSIAVPEGVYEIDTKGLEEFDPVIKLYRIEKGELHLVASNDDVEPGTKDAGITIQLEQKNNYQLEVQELVGNPGSAEVYLRKINR